MTRGLWGDPERYLETYWSRWPDVWVHGDWASVDEDGGWFLHGRSDDTINVAGKRIGPAEVESAAVSHTPRWRRRRDRRARRGEGRGAWVYCVLRPGLEATTSCAPTSAARSAAVLGKAFAPAEVRFVDALPKTRTAKIVRRAVRAAALGEDPGDLSSLENPGALEGLAARGDGRRRGGPQPADAQGLPPGPRRRGDARRAARPRPLGAEPSPDEPVAVPGARTGRRSSG